MITAIILAAGSGRRAGTDIPKQFLDAGGVPVLLKVLQVFEMSSAVDRIVVVTSPDYLDYCRALAEEHAVTKVTDVIEGGEERYNSVWNALLVCGDSDYVMIHDSARPFVTDEILQRVKRGVEEYQAVVCGMPSKDTVKIADQDGFVRETPLRSTVWTIQTPQAFAYSLLRSANEKLLAEGLMEGVTDDGMIVERSGYAKVKLIEGSYDNIKITTPDDLKYLAELG